MNKEILLFNLVGDQIEQHRPWRARGGTPRGNTRGAKRKQEKTMENKGRSPTQTAKHHGKPRETATEDCGNNGQPREKTTKTAENHGRQRDHARSRKITENHCRPQKKTRKAIEKARETAMGDYGRPRKTTGEHHRTSRETAGGHGSQ